MPRDAFAAALRLVVVGVALQLPGLPAPQLAAEDQVRATLKQYAVRENENVLTIARGDTVVLTYNKTSPPAPAGLDPIYQRSGFLHPVNTPAGRTVTATFPVDHPHQHGIFSAWTRTAYGDRNVDFWNLKAGQGRVLHEQISRAFVSDDQRWIGFEADLLHRVESEPKVEVLREHWTVRVLAEETRGTCFELSTRQTALTDEPLRVLQYHYGGVAVRGPIAWIRDGDPDPQSGEEPATGSRFLNDLGSGTQAGNHQHTRWVALSGRLDDRPATIVMMGHPGNFRAHQAARLHPTKPYFVFSPCVDGEFVIDREHPYEARYRFYVLDEDPDPLWLDQQWRAWAAMDWPAADE